MIGKRKSKAERRAEREAKQRENRMRGLQRSGFFDMIAAFFGLTPKQPAAPGSVPDVDPLLAQLPGPADTVTANMSAGTVVSPVAGASLGFMTELQQRRAAIGRSAGDTD